jgi:hypothetical protein
MSPKEKAINLIDKMSTHDRDIHPHCTHYIAKQSALIAVDEILSLMIKFHNRHIEDNSNEIIFWKLVKEEIEKL